MSAIDRLVCPECGHDIFTATLTTRTEYTCAVLGAGLVELSEQVVDGGSVGDADEFVCAECGVVYDELGSDSLVTREQFEADDETDITELCECGEPNWPPSACTCPF